VGAGQVPQYLPPVFNKVLLSPCPPQTIICLSAQTAVCSYRPLGALVALIAIQLSVVVSVVGLYRLPVCNKPLLPAPPQTIIWQPVHTAVWYHRAAGAPVVLVAVQLLVTGLYCPPVLNKPLLSFPPQTIIWLPVHTAVWCHRASGALILVAVQLLVVGLYLPPVLNKPLLSFPPQTIIWRPVHTAV